MLKPNNPVETVFMSYFGSWGKMLFGIMIWAASVTSVVGATYTSLAFLKDLNPVFYTYKKQWALVFVAVSLLINFIFGMPVNLLIFAGYLNAFIPVSYTHLDVYKRQVLTQCPSKPQKALQ